MIGTLPTRLWRSYIQPTSRLLFQELIHKPVCGVVAIGTGLMLAVPALTEAIRHVIASNLSKEARDRLQDGLERIVNGWRLVRCLLVELVLFAIFGWSSLVVTVAAAMFVVVMA
jgi:hypothetical protein